MQTAILCALLAAVLAFFAPVVKRTFAAALSARPWRIFAAPLLLALVFAAASAAVSAFSAPLSLLVLAYALLPTLAIYFAGARGDFAAILLLWLPIEFAAGAALVPQAQRGFLHSVAYAIAILLGLTLFLGLRRIGGMKYNVPEEARDGWLPLVGFALVAPVLIAVGMAVGFIPAPHFPGAPAGKMLAAIGVIFAGTALPEEILFRGLIQNLLMQRFGAGVRTLVAAAVIFGCAHLDNGPQPLPNWRYAIEATIAGVAYGAVFQKSRSIVSSALLHTMVDWTKHFFF